MNQRLFPKDAPVLTGRLSDGGRWTKRLCPSLTATMLGGLLLGSLSAEPARAASSYWRNASGGTFSEPANWAGAVPGSADSAWFSSNTTYTVSWNANATNQFVSVPGGNLTFDLGASTWWVTSQFIVGQGSGVTGAVSHISGTLIVTNSTGTGTIVSGQSANRNYTLNGGSAVADYLNFSDDGAFGWSRFLAAGSLTTLHGGSVTVGEDLVFWLQGGKVGTWNLLGGTTTIGTGSGLQLYTQLGWAYDSRYTLNISGPGTVCNNLLELVVGNTGSGHQVNVLAGAKLASGNVWIGRYGSADVVTVGGINSVWNIQTNYFGTLRGNGQLFLSENASGCGLIITNGGTVNCGLVTITRYTSGKGNFALVTGGGSLWNVVGNLDIGDYGSSNRVTIADGGQVICQTAYLGNSGSTTAAGVATGNAVLVTDPNSTFSPSAIRVGSFSGYCSLLVSNGAQVVCGGSTIVGSQSNATNDLALVTGPGSVWKNSSTFTIGSFGARNSLVISNGGCVFNTRGTIGSSTASNSVVVTGAGSLWTNTDLFVGSSGAGNQLLVNNNALVLATNLVLGSGSASLNNTLAVAGGNVCATNAAQLGVLDARRGTLLLSRGTVRADHLLLTNSAGRLVFNAGRLDSAASSVNNGQPLTVGSGAEWARFNLSGGTHSFANGLVVSSNAWLSGGGTLTGDVTSAGVLAPDHTFGGLNVSGNVQLEANSDLLFHLGGYSPGADSDYFSASGTLAWAGRLHVQLAPGFTPGPFDVFTLAQCSAGDSGSFANVPNGGRLNTADDRGSFRVTYGNSVLQLSDYQALPPSTTNNLRLAPTTADRASFTLQFPLSLGRTYHLWLSTNLTSWVELPVPGYLQPQPGVGQWTDDGTLPGSAAFEAGVPRFYRLSVE